jgi:hypothetical protein
MRAPLVSNIALVLVFFCTCYSFSSAQSNSSGPQTFHAGIAVGTGTSRVKNAVYPGYHNLRLNAGAFVSATLPANSQLRLELLYSQKGAIGVREIGSSLGSMFERYDLKLDYAEIPFQFLFWVRRNIDMGLGLCYGRLIAAREELFTDPPVYINSVQYPFRLNDYSFLVSCNLKLGAHWLIDLRYQQSMVPVRKKDEVPPYIGWKDQYNSAIALRLAYVIL